MGQNTKKFCLDILNVIAVRIWHGLVVKVWMVCACWVLYRPRST